MLRRACALAIIALALSLFSATGAATTTKRTFVASYGNDANLCSIAAPCRNFTRAIAQTSVGGEVIVLDSAGYGAVSITQSVTIAAPGGVYAGISVSSGDGVTINGGNLAVVLRGLTINGQGGDKGINILNAATVHVESCVIADMLDTGIKQFAGTLEVKDTIVRNNVLGVYVQGPGQATLDHVRLEGNATGLAAEYDGHVAMQDSVVTGSSNVGVLAGYGADGSIRPSVTITRSLISFNQFGIYLDPGSAAPQVQISDSMISDNANWGVFANGLSWFLATRTEIVKNGGGVTNGGGLRLLGLAAAFLDNDYMINLAGKDLQTDAGTVVQTRSNNTYLNSDIGGVLVPLLPI